MSKQNILATDEAWDERVLGNDDAFVKVADKALSDAVNEAAGTQLISLRISKVMVNELKAIAAKNGGMGYQTLMKQILQRFIDGERRMVWNEYISQKIKEQKKSPGSGAQSRAKARERKAA